MNYKATMVDVIVVGAGLSGLQAAADIHRAGYSVLVLEAMDRVGGKTLSVKPAPGDGVVDLGAAWINDTSQSRIFGLAKRFGLELIEQRRIGLCLRQKKNGRVDAYCSGFGEDSEDPGVLALYQMVTRLAESWLGPDAKALDSVTFKALVQANCPGEAAMDAADLLTGALFGVGASEISSLYVIEHVKSCTGLENLLSDMEDGGQYLRVREGAQTFATRLAELLPPGAIKLSTPVERINQFPDLCAVETLTGAVFSSRKVILSVPTTAYNTIDFNPSLPPAKQSLADNTIIGYHAKMVLVFPAPWWREAGLSGAMESTKGPISFTRDTCSEQDGHYSITCFMTGESGRRWSMLSAMKRREEVLRQFKEVFSTSRSGSMLAVVPAVPQPSEIVEKDWACDAWIRGGPMPVMPPFLLDEDGGRALCKPFGHVHFVGAEMAAVWRGYMEGAVRSGERGAEEAGSALRDGEMGMERREVRALL
ncbi:putative amine oxidase [Cercophora scortea]|uniref:Amine oxidase n=1 Tax=Cercophora scortea TaxID=314031 RepID=A0AAE0IXK9_9PEZI|nr:putative amine oxidase [Cercophora scortea]